jgi:CDGSH-type Zn-finger protein
MPKKPSEAPKKASASMKIAVTQNGPYVVTGSVPLALQVITPNAEGLSWEWKEGRSWKAEPEYYLCRCGQSKNKPFCDGSHQNAKFAGKETASRKPFEAQAEVMDGATLELRDAEELCAFARFCDPAGKIWGLMKKTDNPEARALAIREAAHCPSGRLVLRDKKAGKTLEPELPPSIGVVEDPALGCSGPLWVRGGIPVTSEDGTPHEKRNRVTLCRCGASDNKPFCNGSHASIKFKDGLM